MTVPMGEVPRKLYKLDEEFTSLCADVRTIKLTHQVHGERLNEHGRLLSLIQRDVSTLKTDMADVKAIVATANDKLDRILSRLPQ